MNKTEDKKAQTKGIGGWLSFFIFSLFGSVLLNIISGTKDMSGIMETAGLAETWKYALVTIDFIYFATFILLISYAILAFLHLKPNAVALGKMIMITIFLTNLTSIIFSYTTGDLTIGTSPLDEGTMAFRGLFYSVIWFTYLTLSERVNNTFPKENRKINIFEKILLAIIIITQILVYLFGIVPPKSAISPEYLAQEVAKAVKSKTELPKQLDDITKLVDITAESNIVRYKYIISGVDATKIKKDSFISSLKDSLKAEVCKDADIKNLFDRGVSMEYSYDIEGSKEKYVIDFGKADCSK